MKRALFVAMISVMLPALGWGSPDAGTATIGVIRNSTGNATLTREGSVLRAASGTRLLAGDTLSTGPDGSLGVILRDNSILSLGPGSSLVIKSYLFSPADGKVGLMARISRGTMAYISGLIGKLAPESVRFETPVATIGIRGTYFAVKVGEPAF